ncbi:hypothetical protein LPAF129_09210 [Ligilactobacillus pabuli]|uniref:Uncharacterized protein n=1 Tax=Ligilactobacillus pabuli TaxID=2886039 RepID=A0ABQ5JJH1_9LACO|nr:hypothetical protein [Ligilactobacillus pabuli]GKS81235.1 hypothetical protein LPAF129_09210 [Ligilactobacillus pabuli]
MRAGEDVIRRNKLRDLKLYHQEGFMATYQQSSGDRKIWLLENVYSISQDEIVTDHVWLKVPVPLREVQLPFRCVISFSAEVSCYRKYDKLQHGFVSDYGLQYPQKIQQCQATERYANLTSQAPTPQKTARSKSVQLLKELNDRRPHQFSAAILGRPRKHDGEKRIRLAHIYSYDYRSMLNRMLEANLSPELKKLKPGQVFDFSAYLVTRRSADTSLSQANRVIYFFDRVTDVKFERR